MPGEDGSATSLVSALSFVNARRVFAHLFSSAVSPPFTTMTFIITKPMINQAFASRNAFRHQLHHFVRYSD